MAVYFVTGKLGGGKSCACVARIQEYLKGGRRVATNLDLYLENLVSPWRKNIDVMRLPDKPSALDLDAIGLGYDGDYQGENKNGAVVLDECGTWFNSRTWNEAGRAQLIDWMAHARKKQMGSVLHCAGHLSCR